MEKKQDDASAPRELLFSSLRDKKLPPQLRKAQRRPKANSTASMYISDTISKPNQYELLRCMSLAILFHIQEEPKGELSEAQKKNSAKFSVFSENNFPLTNDSKEWAKVPEQEVIYTFLRALTHAQRLASETLIMTLAYIERLIENTGLVLIPSNWRRIVLGCIMLGCKVWEEDAVFNADFIELFPAAKIGDFNKLELRILELLNFNCTLKGSNYAHYYLELRSLSQMSEDAFPLKPMDDETAKVLEARSNKLGDNLKNNMQRNRSYSNDQMKKKSTRAILD